MSNKTKRNFHPKYGDKFEDEKIVGWENSRDKLKQDTIGEGHDAKLEGKEKSECPYKKGTTFYKWWQHGYRTCLPF